VPDGVQLCDECRAARPAHTSDGIRENRPVGAAVSSYRDGVKLSGAERALEDEILKEYTKARWRKGLRPPALARHPFCNWANCAEVSVHVDHVIPARLVVAACRAELLFPFDPMGGFYIEQNLQGLCHAHHNEKTKADVGKDWSVEIDRLLQRFRKKAT
jgi:5-methylcytosine-specific restriction endonuclease McrA